MLVKVVNQVKTFFWKVNRKKVNQRNCKRLTDNAKEVSIFSENCIGGILYHDLGMKFLSPTVNMFFGAEDFIKFCENLKYYLSIEEFVECEKPEIIGERTYPVAHLDDLTLFLVHYRSVKEAEDKWNTRKKRINWDNIVIINTDREGMTDELKGRFELLPYRKVMFVNQPDETHESSFYIRGYENQDSVGIITDHNTWDGKRPIDQFDWVGFLNGDD